jgi:excisionase family DNA binding protein
MNDLTHPHTVPHQWLDLAEAAHFLGIHFTTLRRWADSGEIPCMRTPGGRRRFSQADLDQFLKSVHNPASNRSAPSPIGLKDDPMGRLASQHIHELAVQKENWLDHLGEMQKMRFKYSGQMLFGLLMQYNSRAQGGEVFLNEAERISSDYGSICQQAGMSVSDTTRAFLFFRHSLIDIIFDPNALDRPHDEDRQRLYQRTQDFFDKLLLAVLEGFCQSKSNSPTGQTYATDSPTEL